MEYFYSLGIFHLRDQCCLWWAPTGPLLPLNFSPGALVDCRVGSAGMDARKAFYNSSLSENDQLPTGPSPLSLEL